MDFIVCDGSRIPATGVGAAVALTSWGPAVVRQTDSATTIDKIEALALSIALDKALTRLSLALRGLEHHLQPLVIYTDQQCFACDHNTSTKHWSKIIDLASGRDSDLAPLLLSAKPLVAADQLRIYWLKSHEQHNGTTGRMMRHADALAFLVAYGSLDADGPLPVYPEPAWAAAVLSPRNDAVKPRAAARHQPRANISGLTNKQLLRTTIREFNADRPTVILDDPNNLTIVADVRKHPFALVDSRRRRARLDPRGTINAVLDQALTVAVQSVIAARDNTVPINVRIVLLGDFPAMATHLVESPTIRPLLVNMGRPTNKIVVTRMSRKQVNLTPTLAPLREMVLRAKAAAIRREKKHS